MGPMFFFQIFRGENMKNVWNQKKGVSPGLKRSCDINNSFRIWNTHVNRQVLLCLDKTIRSVPSEL